MSELDAYDYELPPSAIAQRPLAERDDSRLLVDGDPLRHRHTRDLPSLLGPGDVVVLNRSRVLPGRLFGHRPSGGRSEVLLLEDEGDDQWLGLVRPSRKLPEGTSITVCEALTVVVGADHGEGVRSLRLIADDVASEIRTHGQMPLPPYIDEPPDDPERYQTVFSDTVGSAAAPTAGLHLTGDLLDAIEAVGARIVQVDLHVGLDTFRPVTVDRLDDHEMHSERYEVSPDSWRRIGEAERVVAIGTTVVRTLESVARSGELSGRTDLFIRSPYEFRVVDALMTNFHLPRSTLLVMIDAFIGPRWRTLYETAAADGYRFLSFGDAMFLERAS